MGAFGLLTILFILFMSLSRPGENPYIIITFFGLAFAWLASLFQFVGYLLTGKNHLFVAMTTSVIITSLLALRSLRQLAIIDLILVLLISATFVWFIKRGSNEQRI